jgi:hypothetical protein
MRWSKITPGKVARPVLTDAHIDAYKIELTGNQWDELVRSLEWQDFGQLPEGLARIDHNTGLVVIHLAVIKED